MNKKTLWFAAYHLHIEKDADPQQARDLADKAVAASPKSWWERLFK